jgi:hypothetical protein
MSEALQDLVESAMQVGMDWRRATGMIAMNELFGHFFDVSPVEMFETAAYAQSGMPRNLFVFNDHLQMVRGSKPNLGALARHAHGPSRCPQSLNPAMVGLQKHGCRRADRPSAIAIML